MPSDDRISKTQETKSSSESTMQTQSPSETTASKETLPKVTVNDLIEFSEGRQGTKEDLNDKD